MKFLLVAAIIFVVGVQAHLTEEQKEKVEKYNKECLEETKVDQKLIDDFKKGIYSEDEKLKAHSFCFSKKAGFQDEKGEIQFDVIKKKLTAKLKDEEKVDKLIAKCVLKKEKSEDTAYYAMKCLHENCKDHEVVY